MKKRNPYKTAQQEAMLQYFLEDKHNFLTVKDIRSNLHIHITVFLSLQ